MSSSSQILSIAWNYVQSCILHILFYSLYFSFFRIFLVLFNELYFLFNFFLYSCIISWVHWFVCLCCESRWASLNLLFGILPQIICRFYPWICCWVFFDICAFEGTAISFSVSALTSVRKNIHWEVAIRLLAGGMQHLLFLRRHSGIIRMPLRWLRLMLARW